MELDKGLERKVGSDVVNIAENVYGKEIGRYFLKRYAVYKFLKRENFADDQIDEYFDYGDIPIEFLDMDFIRRFEDLRMEMEAEFKRKHSFARHSILYEKLTSRLQRRWNDD